MPALVFCSAAVDVDDAVLAALSRGDGRSLPRCVELLAFRRDVIASDPDWTAMRLHPRPGDPMADRFLSLEFDHLPPLDQVRDLRYVAARHQLQLVELA